MRASSSSMLARIVAMFFSIGDLLLG